MMIAKHPNWLFIEETVTDRCLELVLECPPLHFCGVDPSGLILDGTVVTGSTSGATGTVVGDQPFTPPNPTFIIHQDDPVDYIIGEPLVSFVGWIVKSQTVVPCPP